MYILLKLKKNVSFHPTNHLLSMVLLMKPLAINGTSILKSQQYIAVI